MYCSMRPTHGQHQADRQQTDEIRVKSFDFLQRGHGTHLGLGLCHPALNDRRRRNAGYRSPQGIP